MKDEHLIKLLDFLITQPENEYIEFKENFHLAEEIGKNISALSNSACIHNQTFAYLVFGIEDNTHKVLGTSFNAKSSKKGNEELTLWLNKYLKPKIEFEVFEFDYTNDKHISLYKIYATKNIPIEFNNVAYIRVGSNTTKLSEHPEKARKIWNNDSTPFEKAISKSDLNINDIIELLNVESYYNLTKQPLPDNKYNVMDRFEEEAFIIKTNDTYSITNLGAILLANNISHFEKLKRKVVRIITYKGANKIDTIREKVGSRGYAVGFTGMMNWLHSQLPANEEIGKAFRK